VKFVGPSNQDGGCERQARIFREGVKIILTLTQLARLARITIFGKNFNETI